MEHPKNLFPWWAPLDATRITSFPPQRGHRGSSTFGVSAAAGVAVVAGGPAAGGAAEEKTEFDVELTEVGSEKIKVIKAVREVTGLGLKEAKEVVDNAPKVLKEQVSKEEAEEIKTKLSEVGATVTLK